jgi:hypothetical protein
VVEGVAVDGVAVEVDEDEDEDEDEDDEEEDEATTAGDEDVTAGGLAASSPPLCRALSLCTSKKGSSFFSSFLYQPTITSTVTSPSAIPAPKI